MSTDRELAGMAECVECGDDGSPMLYSCNFCEADVCPDHRLPENHDCLDQDALEDAKRERGPVREPAGADHKRCVECENAVAPGEELCPDCKYSPTRSSTSPSASQSTSEAKADGGRVLTGLRYSLETGWIRTRGWVTAIVLSVVIFGVFFSGLYLFMTRSSSYFGVEVPEVVLGSVQFAPLYVSSLGGIALMVLAVAIGVKRL